MVSPEPLNLTVLPEDFPHKPRLLFEPEAAYNPVLGEDLTIPCSASGSPKPVIFWKHKAYNAVSAYIGNTSHGLLRLVNVTHNTTGAQHYFCSTKHDYTKYNN